MTGQGESGIRSVVRTHGRSPLQPVPNGHAQTALPDARKWPASFAFWPERASGKALTLVGTQTITVVSAWQRNHQYASDQGQDRQDKHAPLRPRAPTADQCTTVRVCGKEMMLHHQSTVRNTIEKGLGPIPGRVETNRPPERASAPETQRKNQTHQAGGEQADRRLAWVLFVTQSEEDGKAECGSPKTEVLCMRSLKQPGIDAG